MQKYRIKALLPYLFLVIATLSQLAVPKLVSNIIDAVTSGVVSNTLLDALSKIPAAAIDLALPRILETAKLPAIYTAAQLMAAGQQTWQTRRACC